MRPGTAIASLWLIWVVSWFLAAFWSDPAQKRAGIQAELRYRALWLIGAALLFIPAHGYAGRLRFWFPTLAEAWICAGLIAIGLIFAWWARLHLGRLWSASVTAKAEHRVVDTGPYGLVRHPIYTGLLLAILATMAAKGTVIRPPANMRSKSSRILAWSSNSSIKAEPFIGSASSLSEA